MYSEKLLTSRSAGLLRSLAAIRRIRILDALTEGSKNVGQLAACGLGCASGVSAHLRILYGCGLISRETRGRQAVYSISPTVKQLCIELEAVPPCALKRQLEQ